MIKKLRNQPYAPKVGVNPQVGAGGNKKEYDIGHESKSRIGFFLGVS
jgi:hypothetical protein